MPNPATNSGIRDNHKRGVVADFLKAKIHSGSRLSVVSAYFTIYAYEALKDRLDQIEHLDFLFGEPRFIASLDPDKTEKKAFILDGNGLHLANKLQQKRLRGGAKTEHGLFLHDGVTGLQNHLVNQPFRRDEARIAAGKVACAAAWIHRRLAGVTIEQLRFQANRLAELRDLQIQAPWLPLNRLKGGNAQAFHYWYQAQKILST